MTSKRTALEDILRAHAPLLVAYSGGVDSSCLLAYAVRVLGPQVTGVIADSASLPRQALADALSQARAFGATVEVVPTGELSSEDYASNPPNRCYFCKAELFQQMDRMARDRGFATIAYGENADDPADARPGSRAAGEFRVIAPLKMAGLTKADVRSLAREFGLPTADAPAQPCLASRIPHGTRVTAEALAMVESAEAFVRSLGFRVFRVRYIAGSPPGARIQISPAESVLRDTMTEALRDGVAGCGFGTVEIDPAGYK